MDEDPDSPNVNFRDYNNTKTITLVQPMVMLQYGKAQVLRQVIFTMVQHTSTEKLRT